MLATAPTESPTDGYTSGERTVVITLASAAEILFLCLVSAIIVLCILRKRGKIANSGDEGRKRTSWVFGNLRSTSLVIMNATTSSSTGVDPFTGTQDVHARNIQIEPLITSSAVAQSSQTTLGHNIVATRDRRHEAVETVQVQEIRNTTQPENPFLPRYSIDPYNTAQHIPKWMKLVATLADCTCDGRSYYDEHNDLHLEIPEGAIPGGERLTIGIGVALYGPFQYPKGLRPVSPVFWVCVRGRENYRFLKPVKVTIEHCLRLDRDTEAHSLGLTFLKAGHTLNSAGMYELHLADGPQDFQSDLSHGTLITDHFCFLCINAKDDHETAKKNGYFLIPAYVNQIIARGIQVMQFFITLKLKCCVETVKIQCRDKGYEFNYRPFYFNLENGDGVLTIKYTCAEPEMWNIGLKSSKMVSIIMSI